MQDRQSTYPGRVMLVPVPGAENTYDMTLADIPIKTGTALNKKNLLQDSTAALMGLDEDATPNDALAALAILVSNAQSTANSAQNAADKLSGIIKYGTSDLTAGSSNLETGTIYLVYK